MFHASCLACAYLHKQLDLMVCYTSMDSTLERNTRAGNHKGYVHKFWNQCMHAGKHILAMRSACQLLAWPSAGPCMSPGQEKQAKVGAQHMGAGALQVISQGQAPPHHPV